MAERARPGRPGRRVRADATRLRASARQRHRAPARGRKPWWRALAAAAAPILCAAAALAAQSADAPTVRAHRLTGGDRAIVLDGRLDEAAWSEAVAATGFRQLEPREGAPATETTRIHVVYDADNLYIGVDARDREPDAVIARLLRRDGLMRLDWDGPRFEGDDAVAILLDPFHDHRNAVVFAVNPNGARFDASITDEGREFNIDWRAVWHVATVRTERGWSAELEIPFRTLRYPVAGAGDAEPWGFNAYRVIRRKNEEALWSGWSRDDGGFTRVSRAGHLEGLESLPRPGLALELKPFALAAAQDPGHGAGPTRLDHVDAGLDAKYEIRPGLVLDVTVNPDFAHVEADSQQVNLTRFDLFFPEKRDFFLENAGIFEFGWKAAAEPPPLLLFFSRRIGLGDAGATPVLGGVRLSGRAGAQTVGLLNVVTGADGGAPGRSDTVLRAKRDVGGNGYLGAMLTDRRGGGAHNTAAGLDGSAWLTDRLRIDGFATRTFTSGPGGDDEAWMLAFDYGADAFGIAARQLEIGAETNAELGFVTRTGIRRSEAFLRLSPRPRALGLRKLDVNVLVRRIGGLDGGVRDWWAGPAVAPLWESGESLNVWYLRGFSRLDRGFDLGPGVHVPAGAYDMWQVGAFAGTSANRPWTLGVSGSHQRFFGGRLSTLATTLRLTPGRHTAVTLGHARNHADVPGGRLVSDVVTARLALAFTTDIFADALVQYSSLDDDISANIRLNLIHRPGSDVFLVLADRAGAALPGLDPGGRTLTLKVTWLARL